MPEVERENTLAREIQDLKRRIANLETAPRLTNASMADPSGVARVLLGALPDGAYGIEVRDENSDPVFRVVGEGMALPYIPVHVFDANNAVAYNGGSFTDTRFWAQTETVSHPGLYFWVAVYCESGVTGEIRISESYGGTTTSAVSCTTGGSIEVVQFRWLHGIPITVGPVTFKIQARRTAGAGSFFVYEPNGVALTAGELCTPTGV